MLRRGCLPALLCLLVAAPAVAKDYHAERFDVRIQVQDDGSLVITETIVFVFESGTFRHVFRTIPTRRTDGVEFVSASMDGRVLPAATAAEAGHVRLRRKNGLRIEWHFAPVSASAHTFELDYLVRGVVTREEGADVLAWRALPSEHAYRIGTSTIQLRAPAAPSAPVALETRRVDGGATVDVVDRAVTILASSIRRNGWVLPRVRFEQGTLIQAPPAWQQRRAVHYEMMPTWLALGGGVLLIGFVLLAALRQAYDAPPAFATSEWTSLIPPDPLPPALAGAVSSNGQVRLEHAIATLFALAERGVLTIREEPRRSFGQRSFTIHRERAAGGLASHEEVLLDIVFRRSSGDPVSLAKARSHLMHHRSEFARAVEAELRDEGLLDETRRAHRARYTAVGLALLVVAILAVIPCVVYQERFGAWSLLVPAALFILSMGSLIFGASETPLSNDGVRRGEAWRAYRRHIRQPQEIEPRWGASGSAEARILPFVVTLGLAAAWSKFMKQRKTDAPAWFQAASHLDSNGAFVALIASGGSGAHSSGAGGGGGGAAGGGSSGAG